MLIMKKALITGITGQDGSYLTELLLANGYEVHGILRRSSTFNTARIDHIYHHHNLHLHHGDLTDGEQTSALIYNIQPDEIYNLGAQSHVRVSFDMPEFTTNVVALGTTRILESIRRSQNNIKFYQASSSEMFGASPAPQNEDTPFAPRSPYACAKTYAYWMVKNYREGYNIFASNGILFNHESPRRGETFVKTMSNDGAHRHGYLLVITPRNMLYIFVVRKMVDALRCIAYQCTAQRDHPCQLKPNQQQRQKSKATVYGIVMRHVHLSGHEQPLQ